jgi:hypothetical protein
MKNYWTLRWLGLSGILGAIVLFAGDMLYYFKPNVGLSSITTMGSVPEWRLLAGGATSLIAAWLYTMGAGQIYFALKPAGKKISLAAFISFAAVMIAYGIAHASFFSIGSSAKNALFTGAKMELMTKLPSQYFSLIVKITYVPVVIVTVLFVYSVIFRKTLYSWWIIPFFPVFPYLFEGIIRKHLSGTLQVIIAGGYKNLIMLVFFLISTIVLWNSGKYSKKSS